MTKTFEEILEQFKSEELAVEAMVLHIEGYEEDLIFSKDMEKPYPEEIHFIVPENCEYTVTFHYRVLKRDLRKLNYSHAVKRLGVAFSTRHDNLSDVAVVNIGESPLHKVTLSKETLPGGVLVRGKYYSSSLFLEGDKVVLTCHWTVEIAKKSVQPSVVRN